MFFSQGKGIYKKTTLIKHLEMSTINHEENEELCSHLSNLEETIKELNDSLVTQVQLLNTDRI